MARWYGAVGLDMATSLPFLGFIAFQVIVAAALRDPVAIVAIGAGALVGVPFGFLGGRADGRRIGERLLDRGALTWVAGQDSHIAVRVFPWAFAVVALFLTYLGEAVGVPARVAQWSSLGLFTVFLSTLGLSFLMRGASLREFQYKSGRRVETHFAWGSKPYRILPPPSGMVLEEEVVP